MFQSSEQTNDTPSPSTNQSHPVSPPCASVFALPAVRRDSRDTTWEESGARIEREEQMQWKETFPYVGAICLTSRGQRLLWCHYKKKKKRRKKNILCEVRALAPLTSGVSRVFGVGVTSVNVRFCSLFFPCVSPALLPHRVRSRRAEASGAADRGGE